MSEIFNDHEGVVVGLDEPVELLVVVPVTVLKCSLCFAPEILPPLRHVEVDGPQRDVLLGAHEDQLVAVRAPGSLDVYCLKGGEY